MIWAHRQDPVSTVMGVGSMSVLYIGTRCLHTVLSVIYFHLDQTQSTLVYKESKMGIFSLKHVTRKKIHKSLCFFQDNLAFFKYLNHIQFVKIIQPKIGISFHSKTSQVYQFYPYMQIYKIDFPFLYDTCLLQVPEEGLIGTFLQRWIWSLWLGLMERMVNCIMSNHFRSQPSTTVVDM